MKQAHYELLLQLKQRYLESVEGLREPCFQIEDNGANLSARQFYLRRLDDNLVRPMAAEHVEEYGRGSGNELEDKMKALRSSSAMTFNLLGNGECSVAYAPANSTIAPGAYSIQYERQLPTLIFGFPANLDALLDNGKGSIIACEMKMLEWLTNEPAPLKKKYFDEGNYLFSDTAAHFVTAATKLNVSEGFSCYDRSQMFKHVLALYNACRTENLSATQLKLLNCVWEPPRDYQLSSETNQWIEAVRTEEHRGFREFCHIMEPIVNLFQSDLSIDFQIEYLTAEAFLHCVEHPSVEERLLKRYL